jgi:ElaB/YqjD/DUF883 family membrane-anchored ribosome-binding protein
MSNVSSAVHEVERGAETASASVPDSLPKSAKVKARLKRAKDRMTDVQVVVVEKSRTTARAADAYVHDRPWSTAAVALGVGVLVGLLIGRRS